MFTTLELPDTVFTAIFSFNDSNVGAGQLSSDEARESGFTYANGTETILSPAGATNSFSYAVNDAGVVTGLASPKSGNSVGYTYAKGVYSALSFAGGSYFSGNFINASGQVLGEYVDANNHAQSFVATPAK